MNNKAVNIEIDKFISEYTNDVEKILSKYYLQLNTEETRKAIANDVDRYLKSKIEGKEIPYKEINIGSENGTITVTLLKD